MSDQSSTKESLGSKSDMDNIGIQIPFEGNWLNEKYYNSIKVDKSPRRAQKTCETCFLKIPASTNESVQVILNFHEAIEYHLVEKDNQPFQLWESEDGIPVRLVASIQFKNSNKLQIGDNVFVRIKTQEGIEQDNILEQILFKGTFISEEGTEIRFNGNGEVSGLGDYAYYEPLIDYNDAGRDVDQIKLGRKKDAMEVFTFKFKRKKLQIYTLACLSKDDGGSCVEAEFGDLLFSMKIAK